MTKDEFQNLSPESQEEYINSGGNIELTSVDVKGSSSKVMILPTAESHGASTEVRQTESTLGNVHSPAPEIVRNGSGESSQSATPSSSNNDVPTDSFNILNPVELLFLLEDDIATGVTKLHPWQVQFMLDFANEKHTKDNPFNGEVQACNGSGKDKYIVAACIVWLCMRYRLARGVATNGSGVQLDNQTEVYVRHLCEKANAKFGAIVWKCNYRYYECLVTQSPITLFATDEPNKAEGYHPIVPGAKMAIFASEAKAIPDSIFTALSRCTGYTHRVDVSTPGLPMGRFFDACSTSIDRKELKDIKSVKPTDHIRYHITAYDCPHITQNEIDIMEDSLPGGKNSPVFKSAILAEFGTTDEMVVIPYTYVWRAFTNTTQYPLAKWQPELYNKAGLDLSDGGAETVLLVRNGNKVLKVLGFRLDNTEDTLDYLEEQFKENDLNHAESLIFADCCGIGKPMLNSLTRRGWRNIRYIDSRHKAMEPRTYYNRATELFFHMRQLLERHELIIPEDKLLIRQLSTRYYKITNRNVHQLLTKLEQKSRGYPSPDRADACNLAFWDYKSQYVGERSPVAEEVQKEFQQKFQKKPIGDFSLQHWAKGSDSPKQRLGKRPDTTYLMEQINQHNRAIKLQKEVQ